MPKPFIIVSLLIILISACSRPYITSTPPAGSFTSTPTALFNTLNPISTQTPSIVTATAGPSCSAPEPRVEIGQKVTVTVENWDRLKLRTEPVISPDTVLLELEQYSQLEILEGPVCVSSTETGDSYWFWKVKAIAHGKIGWVAEGDYSHYFIENAHG